MEDMTLLEHFIDETNRRFTELHDDVEKISERLEDLQRFKIQMARDAKWVALIISSIGAVISFVGSIAVSFFFHK